MIANKKTLNFNKSFLYYALIILPIVAVVSKDILFQGYLAADNFFRIDIIKAFGSVGAYWLVHLLCFAFVFAFALLFKRDGAYIYTMIVNVLFSIIVLVYLIYLRCFSTIPSLGALRLMFVPNGDIPADASGMVWPITWTDLLLAWDLVFWFIMCIIHAQNNRALKKLALSSGVSEIAIKSIKETNCSAKRKELNIGFATAVIASVVGLAIMPIYYGIRGVSENYENIAARSTPKEMVRNFSPIGFIASDIWELCFTQKQPTPTDKKDIEEFFAWNKSDYFVNEYHGALKGKNLIVIQVESLEDFVIGNTINGQEITPNINKLLNKSYRFDVHDQVSGGNSSDCDLLIMSSILPSAKYATFEKFPHNTFHSLPLILESDGYHTYYYDSTEDSVWGYAPMVREGMRFQTVDFKYDKREKLNTYLSDESYMRQTYEKMLQAGSGVDGENFYAHMVMCSSHSPFVIPKDLQYLDLPNNLKNNVMGDYMQSVRYADEQIGMFIDKAGKAGILDNTAVVITGDHLGLHKYYVETVRNLPEDAKQDWFVENYDGTVPFVIYDSNMADGAGRKFEVNGAQVDIMPTLLYLLGVDKDKYLDSAMGRSLVATNRDFAYSAYGKMFGSVSKEDEKIIMRMPYIADRLLVTDYFKNK